MQIDTVCDVHQRTLCKVLLLDAILSYDAKILVYLIHTKILIPSILKYTHLLFTGKKP